MIFVTVLEFALALIAGLFIGIITGLLPGIHINLVSALVLSSVALATHIAPLALATFIVTLAITHTFLDFIPSIYLGAPEEDTFLATLPGHELLKEGKGHEAVVMALYGSLGAIVLALIASPLYLYLIPLLEKNIVGIMGIILITVCSYTIIREDRWHVALIVFALAGFLGYASFNLPVKDPLLPLLSGLFGASGILVSLGEKTTIKPQHVPPVNIIRPTTKEIRNALLGSILVAPPCSFLPALGSGYAAFLSSEFFEQSRRGFLMLNGAINTFIMLVSFILVYTIGKARTGSAAALETLIHAPSSGEIAILFTVVVLISILAFSIGVQLSKYSAKYIATVNYQLLSKSVLGFISLIIVALSNMFGLIVFLTATALGVFTIKSNVKRIHLMGALLVPTIIYYFL